MNAWPLGALLLLFLQTAVQADPAQNLRPVSYHDLAGWESDDHTAALETFRRSCREILDRGSAFARTAIYGGAKEDWADTCAQAFSALDARSFFEQAFLPFRVVDSERPEGLFTGYYEPEMEGNRIRTPEFQVPIYRKPPDLLAFDADIQNRTGLAYGHLVNGQPHSYFTRREIEEGALTAQGLEIVWLKDWADAFFIHIQGSGRVRFEDGSVMRLTYSAKSGRPYTGIGGLLVERGAFNREDLSMQATRDWMDRNPEAARQLMWENQSFIFFREAMLEDPSLGAFGAQHVQLTPMRSLAIDRLYWMLGTPVWIDTQAPKGTSAQLQDFQHLMIAQDTGSAIRGAARGDVFWGFGEDATLTAGHMKSSGSMTVLLPSALARKLDLAP